MQTIEQVQAAWAALDRQAKLEAWDEFTRSIDFGDHGYDPYYLVLWPMWQAGETPFDHEADAFDLVDLEDGSNDYFDAQLQAMEDYEADVWAHSAPAYPDMLEACPY